MTARRKRKGPPRPAVKPLVAIIDSKNLRRAGITRLFEPWASSENLRLTSFTPDQAHEALQAKPKKFRMLIFTIGEASVTEEKTRQQLKELRALATDASLVIISDREDAQDIATALSAEARGFIHSGITPELAYHALSFILKGGTYFPPSAVSPPGTPDRNAPPSRSKSESKSDGHGTSAHSRSALGHQPVNVTVRQGQILEHVRLGESNKLIASSLGMTEGTVKVHLRQMMRKFHVSNRTQLALGGTANTESLNNLRL